MPPSSRAGRAGLRECWTELLLAATAIRSPWRRRYLTPTPLRGPSVAPDAEVASTIQLLNRAATLHLRPMSCLERSAAAMRILRRRQVPAELRVGVRRSATGAIEAHAWIEMEGTPLDNLASDFAPLEEQPRRRLAGVRLVSGTAALLPDDGTETDVECLVLLGPPSGPDSTQWLQLPAHPAGGRAWVRRDGRSIALDGEVDTEDALAMLLRWAIPFASALQGRVILHASAVKRGGRAWALVGESGVGKSTLARAFARRGWPTVADDLLPCRQGQGDDASADTEGRTGRAVVVLCGRERLELSAVFFIERTRRLQNPSADRLSPAEALYRLLHHGFGELGSEQIWRLQFAFYGVLAEQVAAYRLVIPDDLDRVAGVVSFLEGSIAP